MTLQLNRSLFLETNVDSGALNMLGSVVHRAGEPGEYRGTVYRGEEVTGEFSVEVVDASAPLQAHVDLAAAHLPGARRRRAGGDAKDCCCCDETDGGGPTGGAERHRFTLGREGFLVFHVSTAPGGYAVQLIPAEERRRDRPWDSRELAQGDLFAVTLLRPGTYRARNAAAAGEGRVQVAYPQRGERPYRPPDAARVAAAERGFRPGGVKLQPLQGLVYEVSGRARIEIELVEPDDGPRRPRPEERGPIRTRRFRFEPPIG